MYKDFDIYKFLEGRPLSWSALSSFEYDPEQWFQSYILGIRQTSKEMDFGSVVDKKIQNDPAFFPELPRYAHMQYAAKVIFNKKIPLIGYFDGLSLDEKRARNTGKFKVFIKDGHNVADYKTGKKPWDKKRADETGQITMYLLFLFIILKIPPEKFRCFIHWFPTQDNGDFTISFTPNCKPVTIETKRTMKDILLFGAFINETVKKMELYVRNHA